MNKLFYSIPLSFVFCLTALTADIERRAAIDIGSGGTKVAIADVDTSEHKIVAVIFEASYPVPYQSSLDKSSDGTFDAETKALGLATFKEIQEIALHHQVQKISAIATSAFRKSNNSKEFVAQVEQETAIAISIVPQREEGEIAFFSALTAGEHSPEDVIVWDIGTGSFQMTTMNESSNLTVYMGENMGSVAFKSYVIDAIQMKDVREVNTPNPISETDLADADAYARSFGRRAYPIIKEKIKAPKPVLGIGRLFYNSIRPLASKDGIITRKALRKYIESSLNKTDDELNNPYASVDVTNCILALAIMKALHIQTVEPIDTTTTKGLLIHPAYW